MDSRVPNTLADYLQGLDFDLIAKTPRRAITTSVSRGARRAQLLLDLKEKV